MLPLGHVTESQIRNVPFYGPHPLSSRFYGNLNFFRFLQEIKV